MRQLPFIILVFIVPLFSFAQSRSKNIYAEVGGPGILISGNYDTRLTKSNKGFGIRVGVGAVFDPYSFGYTLPVGLNYLVGKEKNFLEVGTGMSYIHFNEKNQDSWFNFSKESFVVANAWIGYRYQSLQKGFTFRAGVCQFFNDFNLPRILAVPSLYPAVSFGYVFE